MMDGVIERGHAKGLFAGTRAPPGFLSQGKASEQDRACVRRCVEKPKKDFSLIFKIS
jgi:hypothetical protein